MSKKALATVATRQQVLLERLKSGLAGKFTDVLPKLEKGVREVVTALDVEKLSEISRTRLTQVLAELRTAQQELIAKAEAELHDDLRSLAGYTASFEQRALLAAVQALRPSGRVAGVTTNAAYEAALKQPLSATGTLLEPFISSWGERQVSGVEAAVRRAWGEGRTIGQLVQEIRGTKVNNFKDGLVEVSRNQADAVARTSIQHVAQQARQAVWDDNADLVKGVIWVSTLDGHTTKQCRSLDGKKFPRDSGPRPPLHVRCRSTTIADLGPEFDFLDEGATRSSKDGYVPANQTYYEWLKKQPDSFQDEALGASRARLFRDGGLSTEEFSRLNLDRNFQPLTLAEMAKKEPTAFEAAGLDKYLPPTGGK